MHNRSRSIGHCGRFLCIIRYVNPSAGQRRLPVLSCNMAATMRSGLTVAWQRARPSTLRLFAYGPERVVKVVVSVIVGSLHVLSSASCRPLPHILRHYGCDYAHGAINHVACTHPVTFSMLSRIAAVWVRQCLMSVCACVCVCVFQISTVPRVWLRRQTVRTSGSTEYCSSQASATLCTQRHTSR